MKTALLSVAAAAVATVQVALAAGATGPSITMHQDPYCGCCAGWAEHMRENGFKVKVHRSSDMATVKSEHGVPFALSSCHTAKVDATGQIIEGHVPANAVRKMLRAPEVQGVAAPGMPVNSPGMGAMDGNLLTVDFQGRPFSKD